VVSDNETGGRPLTEAKWNRRTHLLHASLAAELSSMRPQYVYLAGLELISHPAIVSELDWRTRAKCGVLGAAIESSHWSYLSLSRG
jgi:hypothetical protein